MRRTVTEPPSPPQVTIALYEVFARLRSDAQQSLTFAISRPGDAARYAPTRNTNCNSAAIKIMKSNAPIAIVVPSLMRDHRQSVVVPT